MRKADCQWKRCSLNFLTVDQRPWLGGATHGENAVGQDIECGLNVIGQVWDVPRASYSRYIIRECFDGFAHGSPARNDIGTDGTPFEIRHRGICLALAEQEPEVVIQPSVRTVRIREPLRDILDMRDGLHGGRLAFDFFAAFAGFCWHPFQCP